MSDAILKIINLSSGYGNKPAINNISFSLKKNQILGIIGPNGSGKTTLLKNLSGSLKSSNGEIILSGKSLKSYSKKEIALKISTVLQTAEYPDITIEDFVLMGRIPYFKKMQFFESENDIKTAEKYMKLTDIYGLKDRLINHISGGERQLALIAKALAQEPEILLLDEPISHLDITHQIVILDLIKKLNNDLNISIIMILHDINFACEYCDRILIIKNGALFKEGKPEEVMSPEILKKVYNIDSVININPVSKKPFAVFLSNER